METTLIGMIECAEYNSLDIFWQVLGALIPRFCGFSKEAPIITELTLYPPRL